MLAPGADIKVFVDTEVINGRRLEGQIARARTIGRVSGARAIREFIVATLGLCYDLK